MSKKKIYLPLGCHMGTPSVTPANWLSKGASLKKDWFIHYRFHDPALSNHPKYKYGLLRSVRGMNEEKTLEKRRAATKIIIEDEIALLKEGYNPITGKSSSELSQLNFELSPQTPFIKALWKAVDKVRVTPNYLIDMKCMIRGIAKAAHQLNITNYPISQITRKYIKVLLEKCGTLNKRWSARRHNAYRTTLIALFRELIEMEAVDINPVRDVSKKKETKKERLTLTLDERALVSSTLFTKHYKFWRVIQIFFHSGSRETELLNVKGKHVDLVNQSCLYTVKKGQSIREVRRPIKDIALPLWRELMINCEPENYLISTGLIPGPGPNKKSIRPEQLTRRWRTHVKQKLNIRADLYSLKHSNTTDMMDELQNEREVAKLTGHASEAMVINIYDIRNKQRKDDKIKKVNNPF